MSKGFDLITPAGLFGPDPDGVESIPLEKLESFENHPFFVKDDKDMTELVNSIRLSGILNPLIVREKAGAYQIIAGHRRAYAAKILGLMEVPCIKKTMTDDEAVIAMVDSNLARETILPSEKARAFKMKLDALKHQGISTSAQIEPKYSNRRTRDTIGREMGESGANVQRYIRLNELIPELLNLVDIGNLGFNTAVELSYLHVDTQKDVWAAIEVSGNYPSGAQAKEFRSLHKEGALDLNRVLSVLTKGKKDTERLVLSSKILYQYFPKSYTPREMEAIIEKLLAKWAEDGNGGVF